MLPGYLMVTTESHRPVAPRFRTNARALRRELTEAEVALWRALRDRRLAATKWRRQFPMGPFIVDFVCLERRVVVECDGSQHAGSTRDGHRDAWLAREGFQVVRFWNHEVLKERRNVIDTILARCGLPI
jgi:very-short-patch-repair endonuclease